MLLTNVESIVCILGVSIYSKLKYQIPLPMLSLGDCILE